MIIPGDFVSFRPGSEVVVKKIFGIVIGARDFVAGETTVRNVTVLWSDEKITTFNSAYTFLESR